MDDDLLIGELRKILAACEAAALPVFVVGAFSIRAYDCLFRVSQDLDLAVTAEHWPRLKLVLESLGYSVAPENVWITAVKSVEDSQIEINIALNGITDLDTALSYPLDLHRPEYHRPADLNFALPVLPLEAVVMTKLIALREKDVADLLGLLLEHGGNLQPERFWGFARAAGIHRPMRERLRQMAEYLVGGEAVSIWYDRTGAILADTERDPALAVIRRLLKSGA